MAKLTHKELLRQLDYNHLTGILRWKVSNTNTIQIGDVAGTRSNGYVRIKIGDRLHMAHRLAWFHYYGYMPENEIDHKDQIRHHNWILNLRQASSQCQKRNTGNPITNTSGVKGVSWQINRNKWQVGIGAQGKRHHLGNFKDFDEAVCHRLAAEQCLDWAKCDNSSPAFKYVRNAIQGGNNCAERKIPL